MLLGCSFASGPGGCWPAGQRFHANLAVAAVTIGAVSITQSLAELELGDLLGAKTGERDSQIGAYQGVEQSEPDCGTLSAT
jgi:hypothetical protein